MLDRIDEAAVGLNKTDPLVALPLDTPEEAKHHILPKINFKIQISRMGKPPSENEEWVKQQAVAMQQKVSAGCRGEKAVEERSL